MNKFRQPFAWEDAPPEPEVAPVDPARFVKLPDQGWTGTGPSAGELDSRQRRGIEGAAKALREQSQRAGSDPGRDACVDRVRVAVNTSERRDR